MSPKKKRPQAAQALIDQLLDEKPSQSKKAELRLEPDTGSNSEPVLLTVDNEPIKVVEDLPKSEKTYSEIDFGDESFGNGLSLDVSKPHQLDPIAKADQAERTANAKRAATQMSKKIERLSPEPSEASERVVGDEPTVRLQKTPVVGDEPTVAAPRDIRLGKPQKEKPADRNATEVRGGFKLGFKLGPQVNTSANVQSAASAVFASSEAALKQSESLRIAQARITELEKEVERVRRENEDLGAAGETLRRRADELISKTESLEIKEREAQRIADEERKVFRGQLQAKDRENAELRTRVEEIELRLESNFKKIRVRERELEHRLEIVKMESATLVSTKDKMILELKRQIDQLSHENDHAKSKTQELFNQYKDKQETIRRVVRALRIALTILEGDDETVVPLKKAE